MRTIQWCSSKVNIERISVIFYNDGSRVKMTGKETSQNQTIMTREYNGFSKDHSKYNEKTFNFISACSNNLERRLCNIWLYMRAVQQVKSRDIVSRDIRT